MEVEAAATGDEGAAGAAAAAASGSLIDAIEKDPAAGTAPAAKADPSGRPAYVPEKFWDKEAKTPKVEAMAEGYAALERERARILQGHAGAPEAYEFAVPEELGGKIELDMEDGFTKDALAIFKKHGITQAAAQDIVGLYLTQGFADMTGAQAEEMARLGPDARSTIQAVNDWARVNLDADTYNTVRGGCNSAASVMAVKALIERMEGATRVPTRGLTPVPSSEREAILAEVKTDKYHKDALYRADVDARLEAAYARG